MKKLFYLFLLLASSGLLNAAADYEYWRDPDVRQSDIEYYNALVEAKKLQGPIDYDALLADIDNHKEIILDTWPGSRTPGYSFKLRLDDLEPYTGKAYRELLKASWRQKKPYILEQFISLDPTIDPDAKYVPKNYQKTGFAHGDSGVHQKEILSSFADSDSTGESYGSEPTQDQAAIDRKGTNLEIEQVLRWQIPTAPPANAGTFGNALIDVLFYDLGYLPFHPESPDVVSSDKIALINPNIVIGTSWSNPNRYDYLVDVLPLSTVDDYFTGKSFKELLREHEKEKTSPEKEGEPYRIARVLTWDPKEKRATISFYDAEGFERLEEHWPDLFKVQIFAVDESNPRKAYLEQERYAKGFYPRGKFNLKSNDQNIEGLPISKLEKNRNYVRKK